MDSFDFGAPVSATIIYDDSDDETIDIKSSEENLVKEIKKNEIEPSSVTHVLNVLENASNTDLLTSSRNASEIEIPSISEHILKNNNCPKNSKSVSRKEENLVLQEKLKDMPIIEEENFNGDICNSDISIAADKSKEIYTTYQNSLETQNKKETPRVNKDCLEEKTIVSIFFSNTSCHTEKQNIKQKKQEAPTIDKELRILTKELCNSEHETRINSSIENKQTSKRRHSKDFGNADYKKRNTNTSADSKKKCYRLTEELNNFNDEKQNKDVLTNAVGDRLQIEPLSEKKQFSDIEHVENLEDVRSDIISTINSSVAHQKSVNKLPCTCLYCNVNRSEIHKYNSNDQLADDTTTKGLLNNGNISQINIQNRSVFSLNKESNESRQTFRCDKLDCTNFICCNKTRTRLSLLEKQDINSIVITSNQQQSVIEDTSNKPHNDINKTIPNYFKEQLSAVSYHMIYIMKSFKLYQREYKNNNVDQRLLEKVKNNFLRTRIHFFDLSYSSVVKNIMPRYNDVTFVKIFLTNTIEIARSKFDNYSYGDMELLFLDMVTWVRKRQEQIQKLNENTIVSPLQTQELQTPMRYPSNQEIKSHKVGRNPIQFGVSNSNAQESLHKANMQHPSNRELLQSQISQRIPPHRERKQVETNSVLHGYSFEPYGINEQNVNIRSPNFIQQNANILYYPNIHPRQEIRKQKNNKCSIQQQNSTLNNIQPHPNHYNHINVQSTTQQRKLSPKQTEPQLALPGWQSDIDQTLTQGFLPKHQEMDSIQNDLQFQHYNPMQTDSYRSSISRDSGFMSPHHFNTNSDLTLEEEQSTPTTTPLITHVTSLNPNISLIEDGNCSVCGKITKQKCLGCFNVYYCGHPCQFQDWQFHQIVCR